MLSDTLAVAVSANSTLSDRVQNASQKQMMSDTNIIWVNLPYTNSVTLDGLWIEFFPLPY